MPIKANTKLSFQYFPINTTRSSFITGNSVTPPRLAPNNFQGSPRIRANQTHPLSPHQNNPRQIIMRDVHIPKSWGLILLAFAFTQLILTTRSVRTVPDVVSRPILMQCALILAMSLLAATILTGPLVAKGDERFQLWEAEKLARRPDFEVMNHRGMFLCQHPSKS